MLSCHTITPVQGRHGWTEVPSLFNQSPHGNFWFWLSHCLPNWLLVSLYFNVFLSSLRARMPKTESHKIFSLCGVLDMFMIQSNYNIGETHISNSFYDGLLHFTKCRWETINVDEGWWKSDQYNQIDWKTLQLCWKSVKRNRMRRIGKGIWNLVDQQKVVRVGQTGETFGPWAHWGMRKKKTTFRRVKMKVCNHHIALASSKMVPKNSIRIPQAFW